MHIIEYKDKRMSDCGDLAVFPFYPDRVDKFGFYSACVSRLSALNYTTNNTATSVL